MIQAILSVVGIALGVSYSSILVTALSVVLLAYTLYSYNKPSKYRENLTTKDLLSGKEMLVEKTKVDSHFDKYAQHFGDSRNVASNEHRELQTQREKNYQEMVNTFYDLVTDFYEYAWGPSFHFAPRFNAETFMESLRRHEYYLALKLQLGPGKTCVDLGCGVGGPLRNIARFCGADITGLNNSAYQVKICDKHNKREGLDKLVTVVKGDFMHQPFDDKSFDAAYQIEAACHAPDPVLFFKEINRVLKPGGLYAGYEWLITEKFDAKNKTHVKVRQGIEQGNGIPCLKTPRQIKEALKKAGFEVLEAEDRCPSPWNPELEMPWFQPLAPELTWENLRSSKLGRIFTSILTYVLETVRIAPKGTYKVQTMLTQTADDLVAGGKDGIFTPAYFFLARKI